MLALLSGRNIPLLLQPAHWMSRIDCLPRNVAEFAAAWGIHPEADIEILPPLAGFVGSDLLAGVLATELTETGAGSLFIDFGTNSEIALWDGGNTLGDRGGGWAGFRRLRLQLRVTGGTGCHLPGSHIGGAKA